MTFRHLNDEDRAEIWALHGQGYLATEIHKNTGRSFTTITALIKRHGGIRPARPPKPTGHRLNDSDREGIALGIAAGDKYVTIAERIGRHHTTCSREVARNGGRGNYRCNSAAKAASERAKRPKELKLDSGTVLGGLVRSKLETEWSPEQISAWLKNEYPDDEQMRISPESIYVADYTSTAGMDIKHLQCLRQGDTPHGPLQRGHLNGNEAGVMPKDTTPGKPTMRRYTTWRRSMQCGWFASYALLAA